MENITTTSGLRNAIEKLEAAQFEKGQLLKEQLNDTLEGLKPNNLLKSALSDFSLLPAFSISILGSAAGLATGYLSQKLIVGASANVFRRIFGTFVQLGVTNFVSRHQVGIKKLSNNIFQRLFHKNREISEEANQHNIEIN
jgi:hypothetical protein